MTWYSTELKGALIHIYIIIILTSVSLTSQNKYEALGISVAWLERLLPNRNIKKVDNYPVVTFPFSRNCGQTQGCNHQSTCIPQLQPSCSSALVESPSGSHLSMWNSERCSSGEESLSVNLDNLLVTCPCCRHPPSGSGCFTQDTITSHKESP